VPKAPLPTTAMGRARSPDAAAFACLTRPLVKAPPDAGSPYLWARPILPTVPTPARLRFVYESLRLSLAARGFAFSLVGLEGAPVREVAYLDGRPLYLKAKREGRPVADAPLTILLHGLGSSLATWSNVLPRIARRVPVVAVDLPGFGRSLLPDGVPFATPQMHLDTALAFLDAVAPDEKVQLVGQSLGGGLAAHVALRAPERISRLTLANATGLRHAQVHEQVRLFRPQDDAELIELWRRMWRRLPLSFHLLRRDYLDLTRMASVRGFLGSVQDENFLDLEDLARITHPTLLVWGLDDRLIDYDFARGWRSGLPDVRFRPIPEFLRYVLPWLEGREPPEPEPYTEPSTQAARTGTGKRGERRRKAKRSAS
jgi:pimeloyl-ACP methyl ester carboxylesterase